MNIVLIGYRGTGKTCVAKRVAAATGRRVVDTDAEIVRRIGGDIPSFVAREGWEPFRDVESEVCRDVAAGQGLVIATGGGIVLRAENVAALRAGGRVFWLRATPESIAERIREDTQRPSLTGQRSFLEEIDQVLTERLPLYEAAADRAIDTDRRSVDEVACEIVRAMEAEENAG